MTVTYSANLLTQPEVRLVASVAKGSSLTSSEHRIPLRGSVTISMEKAAEDTLSFEERLALIRAELAPF